MGGAIHAAIEAHFRQRFQGESAPSIDELMDVFDRAWRTEASRPIRFGKGESESSLRDLALRMLEAFQADEVSKLDTELLAVEEEFREPAIVGCPDLLGRIDLILLGDGLLRVIDFKTSRCRWTDAKVQEASPQALFYTGLVRPLYTHFNLEDSKKRIESLDIRF